MTWLRALLAALLVGLTVAVIRYPNLVEVLFLGDARGLRNEREGPAPPETARRSPLLVIGIDGLGRDVFDEALGSGAIPHLARLLGDAYVDRSALSVIPAATLPGWATLFSAEPPGRHGITGDELFLRDRARFVAPIPVSVGAPGTVAEVYTDDLAGDLLLVPTIYRTLRNEEPGVRIWVSMSQFYEGADRLLLASRAVLGEAVTAVVDGRREDLLRAAIAAMDGEIVETVADELDADAAPEILTIYLPGTDLLAHHTRGPVAALQRNYLAEVVDPAIAELTRALDRRGALDDRFVVLVSDHGHMDLVADDAHALEPDRRPAPRGRSSARGSECGRSTRRARTTSKPCSPTRARSPTSISPIARGADPPDRPARGRTHRASRTTCSPPPTRSFAPTSPGRAA